MAADTDQVAVVETKFGRMVIEFYDKDARTTANFIKLAKEVITTARHFIGVIRFYDPGGDPNTRDDDRSTHGTGGPGYTIEPRSNATTNAAP